MYFIIVTKAQKKIPHPMTEPERENILLPTPRINPSSRPSIEGDNTELANPVVGTNNPAEKIWAISL